MPWGSLKGTFADDSVGCGGQVLKLHGLQMLKVTDSDQLSTLEDAGKMTGRIQTAESWLVWRRLLH